ncbi:GntR family transcriptional regulator [Methylopila sp. Yamaguchi]|uniref:GntR family transcriptional regulator n=1 Tax=Methylopila sp. Yamaguchi TaxID=1437817 RepID=UPI000CCBDAEE|nr:GntR family transcriptional regulator [Methylopila sp. Yamaguchi]
MAADSDESESGSTDRLGLICRALRRAILERALRPGDKLPEDALGERFGVSRTIARYALGQLGSEGLVELRRNRIAVVATPSWEEARDLFDVRVSLERLVVKQLAGRLTREQIEELEAGIAEEREAQGGPESASIRLATEFHITLAEMTGSPILIRYVSEIGYRCGLTLSLFGRPHSSECAVNEHLEIVAALASGDADRACALMDHHLEAVASRALVSEAAKPRDIMDVLAPYVTDAAGPKKRRAGG